mmetsp:Transcript_39432/g.92751  ORF Transcript_39432/g.92751 Transcript_39432/m.92751 type:complete len:201 (-) Transcript_39432:366-968(-)
MWPLSVVARQPLEAVLVAAPPLQDHSRQRAHCLSQQLQEEAEGLLSSGLPSLHPAQQTFSASPPSAASYPRHPTPQHHFQPCQTLFWLLLLQPWLSSLSSLSATPSPGSACSSRRSEAPTPAPRFDLSTPVHSASGASPFPPVPSQHLSPPVSSQALASALGLVLRPLSLVALLFQQPLVPPYLPGQPSLPAPSRPLARP